MTYFDFDYLDFYYILTFERIGNNTKDIDNNNTKDNHYINESSIYWIYPAALLIHFILFLLFLIVKQFYKKLSATSPYSSGARIE